MIRLVLATEIQHMTRQLYLIFLFFNLRNLRPKNQSLQPAIPVMQSDPS